eukprot:886046-Amphidinium_carterae.1
MIACEDLGSERHKLNVACWCFINHNVVTIIVNFFALRSEGFQLQWYSLFERIPSSIDCPTGALHYGILGKLWVGATARFEL